MNSPSIRGKMFLQILKRSKYGTVDLVLPDGRREKFGEGLPQIQVEVKSWEALDQLFSKGDLGLAETIVEGTVVVDKVAELVEWACRNDQALGQAIYGSWYGTLLEKVRFMLNRNDRKGAQKNIMAHYDLGNEFYSLWLDASMTYSSALFERSGQDLGLAQAAKYDRIISELNIKSGDHLLEIGCGWGGFFSHVVERTDCKVTAVMNSPEQARYNRQKVAGQSMGKNVNVVEQDYRDIAGKFDKVVSIEMIEAVGEKYWGTFFGKVSSSLKNGGEALIQGITIREDLFYSYKKSTDFIQQYVFPGGMLLTNKAMGEQSEKNGMKLSETFEFGQHYADTLKVWRDNFNKAIPHVYAMGFDEKFVRLWNLYLSYCEGAFRAERINVAQFLISK